VNNEMYDQENTPHSAVAKQSFVVAHIAFRSPSCPWG